MYYEYIVVSYKNTSVTASLQYYFLSFFYSPIPSTLPSLLHKIIRLRRIFLTKRSDELLIVAPGKLTKEAQP